MAVNLKDIAAPSAHQSWDPDVNDSISGIVTHAAITGPKPNFDGDKQQLELRVDLLTEDGEQFTVWAVTNTDVDGDGYPSRLARAIAEAVSEARGDELEEGSTLAIVRVEDVPPKQKGRHPAKNFEAAYKRPSAKVKLTLAPDPDDDDDDDEAEEAPKPAAKKPRKSAADLLG